MIPRLRLATRDQHFHAHLKPSFGREVREPFLYLVSNRASASFGECKIGRARIRYLTRSAPSIRQRNGIYLPADLASARARRQSPPRGRAVLGV